jgi:hypothetical protein
MARVPRREILPAGLGLAAGGGEALLRAHEKGQPAAGRLSCIARRPSPIAVTARAGSPFHRAVTALSPATGVVTSQEPSASWPRASGRGTG